MSGGLTRLMNAPLWMQRFAAMMTLVLAGAIMAGLVMAMASAILAKHEELRVERDRAGRLLRIVSMNEKLDPPASGDQSADGQSLFLEAGSPAIGRAEIQSRIAAIAATNKIELASVGSLPDRNDNGYQMIGLRTDMNGTFGGIHETIMEIESSLPPMFVREMTIQRTGPAAKAPPGPPQLTAQLKIFVAYQPAEARRAAASERAEVTQ